jgi:hypothetical protein
MTTPGFFELYSSARPALPAGAYTATSSQDLVAVTPHDGPVTVPVDDTAFHLHIDAPRYAMPPEQILSTFPPANAEGDWRERLPQIVLKRRTLPWERNPTFNPALPPEQAPPWLALVVLADGEGQLSTDVEPSLCVSGDVDLGPDADVPKGRFLEVSKDIVEKVFPCRDELDLLCHVRKVDLADTELALGDDDGYLAVVLSNRLPQPAPPKQTGQDPLPLKYTAYLINLEHQLDKLLATEPNPKLFFNSLEVGALVNEEFLAPAPEASLDQIAMQLGPATAISHTFGAAPAGAATSAASAGIVSYETSRGLQAEASAWATGPVKRTAQGSDDLAVASDYRLGLNDGILHVLSPTYRFPVLVSWDFTCTADGGFERLMNKLDVGLLGTLDSEQPPPVPEVAPTGHVALSHCTRRGEPARSWYRGPLTPQPTQRVMPVDGELPLAHTGDQLRRVVPDGREDISLAALFEIGRLLALNKPTLVAALMQWRRELFGAARARELAEQLSAAVLAGFGLAAAGGRNSLEDLVRSQLVGAFTAVEGDQLAPRALEVTRARVPDELGDLSAGQVIVGLGANPKVVQRLGKQFGVDGLAAVPVAPAPASQEPVSQDERARAALTAQLGRRVDQLVVDALKFEPQPPVKGPAGEGGAPARRRSRRKDALDRLIDEATAAARKPGGGD